MPKEQESTFLPPADVYRFRGFAVEPRTARLLHGGEELAIEPKAFQLLLFLLEHRDRVVTKEELLREIWADAIVTENSVSRAVARLRKVLGDDSREPCYVATVHSRGYRFLASVEVEHAAPEVSRGARTRGPVSRSRLSQGVLAVVALAALAALVAWGVLVLAARDPERSPLASEANLDPARVAILPLVDLSGLDDQDHVVDGFTERMISVVSRLDGVRAVPRTTVMTYKDSSLRLAHIGRELEAGTVIEGSLLRREDRFLVTLRLVATKGEELLWSKEFEGTLLDLYDSPIEVAMQLGRLLDADFESPRHPVAIATREPSVLDLYLRGRRSYRRWTRAGNEQAIEFYREALELEPEFAPALAGLANAYARRVYSYGYDSAEWGEASRHVARRALEVDPDSAAAYKALGILEAEQGHLALARRLTNRALEIDPEYDEAMANASRLAMHTGHLDEALLHSFALGARSSLFYRNQQVALLWQLGFDEVSGSLAVVLQEEEPLDLWLGLHQIARSTRERDFEAARAWIDRLGRAYPDDPGIWYQAGQMEARSGEWDVAIAHFERALETATSSLETDSRLRLAALRHLREPEAAPDPVLEEIASAAHAEIEGGSDWFTLAWRLAVVHTVRGDVDEATKWITRAVDLGLRRDDWERDDPIFGILREDPRYVAQLDRMRLARRQMSERVLEKLGPDLERTFREAWSSRR